MKRGILGTRITGKTLAILVAIVLAVAALCALPMTAFGDTGDEPAHGKTVTDNKDGTYKIELSVTGDASEQSYSDTHVNVLVVYDESSSMTMYNAPGKSTSRADYAEATMYSFLDDLNTIKNEKKVDIQAACVGFGGGSDVRSGWTATITNVRDLFDATAGDGTVNNVHAYSSHNATNWSAALSEAESLIGDLGDRSEYPTFVILVTDGGPTAGGGGSTVMPGPDVPWTSYERHYAAATAAANRIQSGEHTTLYGIYAFGSDANLLDDLMYYANKGEHRVVDGESITNTNATHDFGQDDGADNYFLAENVDDLEAAIESIFHEILDAIGIAAVSMSDGTTNQVKTSTGELTGIELLGVDEDSYQYWLSIPVNSNNQFTAIYNGEKVTYTVSDDGTKITWGDGNSISVENGSFKDGEFKFEWTKALAGFYDFAPPEAQLVDGAVDWDLSGLGVLLNGVTYSVTFNVYPSQTALDYKAKLDNGEAYTDVVPEAAREYFDQNGGLVTNTDATLTYSDTRDGSGPTTVEFDPQPRIGTESASMTVEKEWEGGTAPGTTLNLDILMDGDEEDPFYIAELSGSTSWQKTFNISAGIIVGEEALEDAMGHDFSFAELGKEQYRWELHAPVVRPMIIDGAATPTILIKADAENGYDPSGKTTYEIDGETYYIDPTVTTLTATNHRRSNLNLTKAVTGDDAPEDATFPFTFSVDNPKAPDEEPADDPEHDSDYYMWFSIQDADGNYVTDATVSDNATPQGDGYYWAKSGDEVTVEMEDGWNLRITNLPSGTTYSVSEENVVGFTLDKVEDLGTVDPDNYVEDSTFEGDSDAMTATGTIEKYDGRAYGASFTNKYESTSLTVKKVWDDGDNRDKTRPDSLALTLNGLPDGVTAPTPSITKSGNTWTYTWSGLPKTDASGEEITYTASEDSVPEGYDCTGSPASNGGTITNSYTPETTSVTVKKEWAGNTETSIKVQLMADGAASGDPVTLSADNQWTYTWEGLYKNNDGKAIAYTVDEPDVPEGYSKEVTDEGEGSFTITNTYNASGQITLTAHKTLKNAKLEAGQFSFQLLDENGELLQTKQNKADGSVTFDPITYDQSIFDEEATDEESGTEGGQESGTEGGENNADSDDQGTNENATPAADEATADDADQAVEDDAAAADETDEATEADVADEGAADAAADDAAADVADETAVMADGDEQAEGAVEAKAEPREKTFTYTIKEVPGDNKKITYDTHEVTVTVTVKDDGKGKITASADYTAEFVNTYKVPTPVIVDPPVQKIFEGPEDLCDELYNNGDFTFTIENTAAPDGVTAPMPANTSITNSATYEKEGMTGYYEFGEIEFKAPGTYTYLVTESGSVDNVTNDPEASSGKSITFTVTEDEEGNLSVSPTTDEVEISFTNTVEKEKKADKKKKTKKKSKLPKAGDGAPIIPMIVLIIAAAVAFMVVRSRRLALDQRKEYRRPNRRGRR